MRTLCINIKIRFSGPLNILTHTPYTMQSNIASVKFMLYMQLYMQDVKLGGGGVLDRRQLWTFSRVTQQQAALGQISGSTSRIISGPCCCRRPAPPAVLPHPLPSPLAALSLGLCLGGARGGERT